MIGGGATGVGIAVDAASRGYSALLLEQNDFGKALVVDGYAVAFHGQPRFTKDLAQFSRSVDDDTKV